MSSREVITLQLGSYANYVGAHFWNLQDELVGNTEAGEWSEVVGCINHDVLYSWGEDYRGNLVYRPRLIAVDLPGSLGGFAFGADGPPRYSDTVPTWGGAVEVHQMREPLGRSSFVQELEQQETDFYTNGPASEEAAAAQAQALEAAASELNKQGGVRYWTDYCKATLNPRSVYQLPGVNDELAFSGYGDCAEAVGRVEVREELQELVRVFSEQCDQLQGFQGFVDHMSGFGKVAEDVLTHIRDEYSSKTVALFALQRPTEAPKTGIPIWRHILTEGLATARLSSLSSLFVPLSTATCSFPHLIWQRDSWFHSSAILATAVDSFTLPWRLNGAPSPLGPATGAIDLASWCSLLAGETAPLAAGKLSFPCAALPADLDGVAAATDPRLQHAAGGQGSTGASGSDSPTNPPLRGLGHTSLTAGVADVDREGCSAECITLRGARIQDDTAVSTSYAARALDAILVQELPRCVLHRCVAPAPTLVPLPFPHIFQKSISRTGGWSESAAESAAMGPSSSDGVSSADSQMNGGGSLGGGQVASAPVLAKLTATSDFKAILQGLEQRVRQVQRLAAAQAIVASWDMNLDDVMDASSQLLHLASTYTDGDFTSGSGDDN